MSSKRTFHKLLALAGLLGIFATGCFYDPYYRHHRGHRRISVDLNVGAPSAQVDAASR